MPHRVFDVIVRAAKVMGQLLKPMKTMCSLSASIETSWPACCRCGGRPAAGAPVACDPAAQSARPAGYPVFVQSFEVTNLKQLREAGLRTRSAQLLSASGEPFDTTAAGSGPTYADLITPAGLRGIASYAQGIGPEKLQVIPRKADGTLGSPTTLVSDAQRAGLAVHPYTFRAENFFLPVDYQTSPAPTDYGRAIDEQLTYLQTGLDGVFTDQADIGVVARAEFRAMPPAE
jgi:glycerophosphoryl diester phosphodiesterase